MPPPAPSPEPSTPQDVKNPAKTTLRDLKSSLISHVILWVGKKEFMVDGLLANLGIAYVGKSEQEHASVLNLIFQHPTVAKVGIYQNGVPRFEVVVGLLHNSLNFWKVIDPVG